MALIPIKCKTLPLQSAPFLCSEPRVVRSPYVLARPTWRHGSGLVMRQLRSPRRQARRAPVTRTCSFVLHCYMLLTHRYLPQAARTEVSDTTRSPDFANRVFVLQLPSWSQSDHPPALTCEVYAVSSKGTNITKLAMLTLMAGHASSTMHDC